MTRSTKQAATSTFTVLFTSALLTAAGLGLGSSAFADAAGLYTAEQAQSCCSTITAQNVIAPI